MIIIDFYYLTLNNVYFREEVKFISGLLGPGHLNSTNISRKTDVLL